MTIVFSDAHNDYDALKPEVKSLIIGAKLKGEALIGVGDIFNLLPWGYDKWVGCQCIDEFVNALGGYPFDYVAGNHDPYRWVKKLFKDYPNIHIHKSLDIGGFYFYHGHGWSLDWVMLRHFAPQIVEFMVDYFPKQWYWVSRRMGWLPSQKKEKVPEGGLVEEQQYDDATGIVWRNAIRYAQHHGITVIVGHTHAAAELRRPVGYRIGAIMLDCGDLGDGTYVSIREGDAHIEYL